MLEEKLDIILDHSGTEEKENNDTQDC